MTKRELIVNFEKNWQRRLSPFEYEDLMKLVDEDKFEPALINEALRETVFQGKLVWKYLLAILKNWKKQGIMTLDAYKEKQEQEEIGSNNNLDVGQDFIDAMWMWREQK
ncbi:TPA: DnaD domain protein [Streptococcus suis]